MGIRHQFSFLHRLGAPAGGRLSLSGLVFWAVSTLVLGGFVPAFSQDVGTEIVRDGTIGADASLQPIESPAGVYEIGEVHGARAGSNLFHSFQSFNIGGGDTARFTADPVPTDNVISRVTGGSSSIFGKIQSTIPGADLYLLNPKGVLFGPEASLDVPGSFHVSTADALHMVDESGNEFLAFSQESLLTTASPVAFGFLGTSATEGLKGITVDESILEVGPGKTLSFIGGDIQINGGPFGYISAPGGRIDLVSVASEGTVRLDLGNPAAPPDVSSFSELGEITIGDLALLSTSSGSGGGSVSIRGGKFVIDGSSRIRANTLGTQLGTEPGIDVEVSGDVQVTGGSFLQSATAGSGDAGDISLIAGGDVVVSEGGIFTQTLGSGRSGDIVIKAGNDVQGRLVLTNGSRVRSATDADGDAAPIQVVARDVEISGGSRIESSTTGAGNASDVTVDASRSIVISNPDADPSLGSFANGISSDVALGAEGNGGDIVITSPSLTLERSVISAQTIGLGPDFVTVGQPGNIRIRTNHLEMSEEALITNNSLSFDLDSQDPITDREILVRPLDPLQDSTIRLSGFGTKIESLAQLSTQSGGNITLEATELSLFDNAQVSTTVFGGMADAGKIDITADRVSLQGGSQIQSDSQFDFDALFSGNPLGIPMGAAGDITIKAKKSISLEEIGLDRSRISTTAFGAGDGGRISLTVHDDDRSGTLSVDNAVIESNILSPFEGVSAGDVIIDADVVRVENGGRIGSETGSGTLGSAGTVTVGATDSLVVLGPSAISTSTRGEGPAGDVIIDADVVRVENGGRIVSLAESGSLGSAGTVTVGATESITVQGSDQVSGSSAISTSTFGEGPAGDVIIDADVVRVENGGLIVSRAESGSLGSAGTVTVGATESITVQGSDQVSGSSAISTSTFGEGPAGDVIIDADVVRVENGGLIVSDAWFSGSAGQVTVGATQSLTVQGFDPDFGPSSIGTSTLGEGPAGEVRVSSERIVIADGGSIDSFTSGPGEGGTIRIGRHEDIPIDTRHLLIQQSGEIFASSRSVGETAGAAGSVFVQVDRLTLEDGGRITASTQDGIGGTIEIRASESVSLDGVDFNDTQQATRIEAKTDGSGDAGSISIQTPVLAVSNGGRIAVSSNAPAAGGEGLPSSKSAAIAARIFSDSVDPSAADIAVSEAGAAGSIFIGDVNDPVHRLTISGGEISAFAVEGPAVGERREGNITVTADGLMLLERGSAITSSVENGLGGDITIQRPEQMVMRDGSQILARTDIGTGGRIEIGADLFISTPDSVVSADAGVGNDGIVILDAPQINLESQLAALSTDFLNASALIRPACAARAAGDREGSFVITHRRGMPLSPEGLLQAFDIDTTAPTRDLATEEAGPEDEAVKLAKRSLAEGESDFRGGRLEEAEEKLAKASAMYAEIGEAGAHSDALRGLAQSQQAQGDHARSVATLLQALALAEQSKDQARIAYTYGSLGNAYLALGDTAKAEDLFDRGVAIAEDLDHEDLQSGLLNNLGNLHATKQSYEKAVDAYEQSAKLAHISGEALKETKALSNAARAALDGEIIPQGRAFLQQALDRAQTLSNTHEKVFVLINIAKSYEQLAALAPAEGEKSLLKAHGILSGAVDLAQEIADIRALSFALGNLGVLYQSKYRYEEALHLIRAALRAAESAEAPELIYRWRWKEGQILWAQGRTGPAIASYRRAVDILEETRQETLSRYGSAEVYFRRAVAPVYLDLVKALLKASEMGEDREMSHRLLINARGTVERFKAAELRDYFRDECVADLESRTTSPESVSQQAAVVYPIILPDRLELLVTLPDGLQRYTVPVKSAKITAKVAEFRGEIQNRNSRNYLGPAQTLYEWLVSPYAKELASQHIDTIVFVPDGPLRTIPMAALHDGKKFLAETYGLVVTPGLAMVDPKPLSQEDQNVLLAGLSEARHNLAALPSVPAELEALSELYGVEPLLNKNFTRSRIEREMAEAHPSIVHIASHAVFTGDAKTSKIYTYDSHISMDGLSDLVGVAKFREDPLEMLVLSACETAAGDDRAALGLAGVAIRAGARSALGSLWPIADKATSELIARFYQELKDPKVSKAIALKIAQSSLIEDSRSNRNHPYYWSPFLLIGNWL